MPSLLHELLVDLFRNRPALARELLHTCAGIELPGSRAEISSADLSLVASPEYRADAVTVIRGDDDVATSAVIVEVQLGIDADKRRSWPVYVAALRASLDCDVILLVIAPADPVARWARTPIDLGHPGFTLTPIVLGYRDIPRIVDPDIARSIPEQAVLSAIAHQDPAVASAALEAIRGLAEDSKRLYWDYLTHTSAAIRAAVEAGMLDNDKQEHDELYERWRAMVERETRFHDAILLVAEARLGTLSSAEIKLIRDLRGERLLSETLAAFAGVADARSILDDLAALKSLT